MKTSGKRAKEAAFVQIEEPTASSGTLAEAAQRMKLDAKKLYESKMAFDKRIWSVTKSKLM